MRKWIHEKTGAIRFSDCSEKTAKGHGFIPFKEAELKEAPKAKPKAETSKPSEDKGNQPKEKELPKETAKPKAKTTRKRTKVD